MEMELDFEPAALTEELVALEQLPAEQTLTGCGITCGLTCLESMIWPVIP